MQAMFENRRVKIKYIEECANDIKNRTYTFSVDIKDFDTPVLNIEYDDNDKVILRTWIENDELANIPKSHVAYKIFSLIEFEVFEIMRFMIKHI